MKYYDKDGNKWGTRIEAVVSNIDIKINGSTKEEYFDGPIEDDFDDFDDFEDDILDEEDPIIETDNDEVIIEPDSVSNIVEIPVNREESHEEEVKEVEEPINESLPEGSESAGKRIVIDYNYRVIRLIDENGETVLASDVPDNILNGLSDDLTNIDKDLETSEERNKVIINNIMKEHDRFLGINVKNITDIYHSDISDDEVSKRISSVINRFVGAVTSFAASTYPLSAKDSNFMTNLIDRSSLTIKERYMDTLMAMSKVDAPPENGDK